MLRQGAAAFLLPLAVAAAFGGAALAAGAQGRPVSAAVYVGELLGAFLLIRAWLGGSSSGLGWASPGWLALGMLLALLRAATWGALVPLDEIRSAAIALAALPYVALAAAAEEVHFRGLMLGLYAQRLPAVGAIVVSSALFALVHVTQGPMWLPLFAADAAAWGALRLRSGSVLPGLIAHGVGNLMTSSILVAPGTVEDAVAFTYLAVVVALDLAVTIWLLRGSSARALRRAPA